MAGVKGKSGRPKAYAVVVWSNLTKEQAAFLAKFSPNNSEAVRRLIDVAQQHGIDAQCADVSKQAA